MNTNDTKQKISQIMASVKVGDVFATRLATVLKNGNIHTMDVLLGKSEVELLKLKDFGKGKLREVAEYFEQVGVGRPPYYDEFPWEAIRGGLKQKGYTFQGLEGLCDKRVEALDLEQVKEIFREAKIEK